MFPKRFVPAALSRQRRTVEICSSDGLPGRPADRISIVTMNTDSPSNERPVTPTAQGAASALPRAASAIESPVRTPMSLRFQLLLSVNATLGILLTLALIADYRRELAHHLRHERSALLAEAETIAAALPALQPVSADSIQRLLDSVLAGMNATDSPRHGLLVEWNGMAIEPSSIVGLRDGPSNLKQALPSSKPAGVTHAVWDVQDFVVGMCSKDGFTVHVSEPLGTLRREIGFETIERLLVLILAGLVAMAVVYFILLRALVGPMEQLSKTVEAIGGGKLGQQVGDYWTAELSVLARSINTMSSTLANHDRERRQQMSKARKLQQHLLAPWPSIRGLTVERRFLPATDVTGDYHEALPLSGGEWLFCIADVTGHGIPAAMTAAMLKVLFHQAASQAHDPHLILKHLNGHLGSVVIPGDFATMLVVHWQPNENRIRYANAGHEPGLLIRTSGEIMLLESDGFMVGAVPEATWDLHTVSVGTGDRLFMYTDGAVEIFNPQREMFGRQRLHNAVAATSTATPRDAIASVIHQLDEFRGSRPFADDVTLLIMEFHQTVDEGPARIP